MQNPIIFLDIDGVLNCCNGYGLIEVDKLERLNLLVNTFDAKIVLISDWRFYDLNNKRHNEPRPTEELREFFRREYPGFPFEALIDRTESLATIENGYRVLTLGRCPEVALAIERYQPTRFVILEDFYDMPGYEKHFVECDGDKGLTQERYELALKILAE